MARRTASLLGDLHELLGRDVDPAGLGRGGRSNSDQTDKVGGGDLGLGVDVLHPAAARHGGAKTQKTTGEAQRAPPAIERGGGGGRGQRGAEAGAHQMEQSGRNSIATHGELPELAEQRAGSCIEPSPCPAQVL